MEYVTTDTGRRLVTRDALIKALESQGSLVYDDARRDVVYAPVSTHKQKSRGDLDRQIDACKVFASTVNPCDLLVLTDVGSGLNDRRKGVLKLISMIEADEVSRVFVTYKDRLTRFGFSYLEAMCEAHGTTIIAVSNETLDKSASEELAEDIISIIHSFSGKLYGMRRNVMNEAVKELS
jgi:predicted site-specific integrase-resolvase